MTEWIKRGEAKNLDAIFIANLGLASSKKILRKDLLINGVKHYDKKIPPYIIEDYSSISQGRYLRTITDSLLSLGLCNDINKKNELKNCKIDDIKDLNKIKKFIQYKNSVFVSTKDSIKMSKTKFASEEWRTIFLSRAMKFGYFVRYLDLINLLRKLSPGGKTKIIECSNLIGPFDDIVKGGGPSFTQKPFLAWAFFSGAINFNTGSLSFYSNKKRLEYLSSHRGVFDNENRILNSFRRFSCDITSDTKKINIPSFIRFANLQSWKMSIKNAFLEGLLKVRIIYLLDKNSMTIKNIRDDKVISEILFKLNSEISFIKIILSLETMGLKYSFDKNDSMTAHVLEKLFNIESFIERINHTPASEVSPLFSFLDNHESLFDLENLQLNSVRSFDKKIFESSLPSGKLVKRVLNV